MLEALAIKRTREPSPHAAGPTDPAVISTLSWNELSFRLELAEHFQLGASRAVRLASASAPNAPSAFNELEFLVFPPGSIVVFRSASRAFMLHSFMPSFRSHLITGIGT